MPLAPDPLIRPKPTIRTVAVVVGIEQYLYAKDRGIRGVDFAKADAQEMAETLKTRFNINDSDLHLWVDEGATKTRFENELKYLVKSLDPNDQFIFYYAGHGFYVGGTNRLTAWDTHPTSLTETTVCVRDVLLTPIELSGCSKVLLFIDACAVPMPDGVLGRDLVSSMDKSEFNEFVSCRKYLTLFMSCSPGEKSFPSQALKHGVWTFHLLLALQGREPRALDRGEWLTDASLRDYLHQVVVKYIRDKTEIKSQQNPYASVNASHRFEILRFEPDQ